MLADNQPKPVQRAALYLRVSTDEQAKEGHYGLEVQEEKCRKFCESQENLTLDEKHIYQDDISGGLPIDRRPKLKLLFEAARNKEFDVVVVYKTDRLARSVRILSNAVHELENLGIAFRSVTEPFDTTTSFGKTALNMFGTFAEFERDQIRERTMSGKLAAAKTGKWVTGIPPYGYNKDEETRKLVINPKEARVVKKIYTMLIDEQLSLRAIEKRLNDMKLLPPYALKTKRVAQQWYKRTIGKILTNEVYTGTFYFRKYRRPFNNVVSLIDASKLRPKSEWVEMHCEPIITHQRFEEAKQQLLRNREFAARNKKREYLYGKIIYCSQCGFKMFGGFQPPKKKWEYAGGRYYHGVYRNDTSKGSRRCEWCPNYSEARLEPIWDCLKEILKSPRNIMASLERYMHKGTDPQEVQERLSEINEALESIRKKQERTDDLFINQHISKEQYKEYKGGFERDERKLNDEAVRLRQSLLSDKEVADKQKLIAQAYERIKVKLDDVSYEEKAKIISLFIDRITLHAKKDYAEVVFKFPGQTDTVGTKRVVKLSEQEDTPLMLRVQTISERERRAFMLKVNPGMYIPKSIV